MRRKLALSLAASIGLALLVTGGVTAGDKWAEHTGNVDFVIGYEKGLKEAEFSGKPMLVFFTTIG